MRGSTASLKLDVWLLEVIVDLKKKSLCNVKQGVCVGLYFINRPEWLIVDHACSAYSYVSVPLYDTLGE